MKRVTPEGALTIALHERKLLDEEASKPPAQRRPVRMARALARQRWEAGRLDDDGTYHPLPKD